MKSSKIDRALYGPSLFEVTLGAILSVAVGIVFAFVFLVLKPVIVVKSPPKENERVQGAVYFVQGDDDVSLGRQWIRKKQSLIDGTPGEVTFNEEELNSWIAAASPEKKKPEPKPAAPAPTKPGAKPAPAAAATSANPDELLSLDLPNVRIREGVFQVGVPGSLNFLSLSLPVIVQAQGDFVQSKDVWIFKPTSLHLGSMPLHRIPGLTDMVMKRIMSSGIFSDDAMDVWKKVSHVDVNGRQLHLTVGQPAS